MKYLLIPIFLLSLLSLHAQAPGFMGKRFFVEAQLGPRINSVSEALTNELQTFTFNTRVAANYVTGRHSYLALEYDRRSASDEVSISYGSFGRMTEFNTTIQTYGLGYYRHFPKRAGPRSLAPIGTFFGYRVFIGNIFSEPVEEEKERYESSYELLDAPFYGGALTFGKRTIINKKISFSAAFELGTAIIEDDINFENDENLPSGVTTFFRHVRTYYSVSLGVGYLLF